MNEDDRLQQQWQAQSNMNIIGEVTLILASDGKIYLVNEDNRTFCQIDEAEKNRIDHQFRAMQGPPYIKRLSYTDNVLHLSGYRKIEKGGTPIGNNQ